LHRLHRNNEPLSSPHAPQRAHDVDVDVDVDVISHTRTSDAWYLDCARGTDADIRGAGNGTAKRKNPAEEGAAEEERVLWWVFEFFRAFSSLRKKRDETSEGGFDGLVDWLIRSA